MPLAPFYWMAVPDQNPSNKRKSTCRSSSSSDGDYCVEDGAREANSPVKIRGGGRIDRFQGREQVLCARKHQGKMKGPVDDLVMTLASDDEVSVDDESEDEMQSLEPAKGSRGIKKGEKDQGFQFQFDDALGYGTEAYISGGHSWNFKDAIARIEESERQRGVVTTSSLEDKIRRRLDEKKSLEDKKKAKKKKAKKEVEAEGVEDANSKEEEKAGEEAKPNKRKNAEQKEEDTTEKPAEKASEQEEETSGEEESSSDEEEGGQDDEVAEEEAGGSKETDRITVRQPKEYAEFFEEFEADQHLPVSWTQLSLSRPLLRAIEALGYKAPTPVQQRVIPLALEGRDICASAQTGSGKTAAFVLPTLERLLFREQRVSATRVLVITPTRELATQCQSVFQQLGRFSSVTVGLVVGGLNLKAQEVELRRRPEVVVCTPGRMIDHLRNSMSVHFDNLEILVLDEADRLLELGFTEEVEELVKLCPVSRQTLLFSATMTTKVDQLIKLSMNRPVRISADPLFDMSRLLVQEFVRIREKREEDREAILLALCTRTFKSNTIVFFQSKKLAHRMMIVFGLAGIKAAELHGDLTQKQRLESLERFKDGEVDILLCTDLAARGIDISGVETVINYEMPKDITTYVHRVGRTARAGRNGVAVTLTGESRRLLMKEVIRHCQGAVKSRAVPPSVIEQWHAKIEGMADDIDALYKEEALDRQLQRAEMEAKKAANLIEHHDEISNRPARTWFMTQKEKEELRKKTAEEPKEEEVEEEEDTTVTKKKKKAKKEEKETPKKPHRLTRQKKRRMKMVEEEQKFAEAEAEEKGTKVVSNEVKMKAVAKTFKKEEAKRKREEADMSISERTKKFKKGGRAPSSGAFDIDLNSRHGAVIGERKSDRRQMRKEKGRDGKGKKQSFEFEERITNLRKGGKVARNSFKSKARYKRRK